MGPVSKLKSIINGWSHYLKKDEQVEAIAGKRAEICAGCHYAVHGTYEKLMPDYSIKTAQGMKCKICQCPLSTKLRSLDENCPIKKW